MSPTDVNPETKQVAIPFLGGPQYLNRTMVAAAVTGGVGALVVYARWGSETSLGFAVGLAWGLANFFVLAGLLRALITPVDRSPRAASGFLVLKLVVYTVGILILAKGPFPILALVAGFSWLFVVVLLRAAGALFLLREDPPAEQPNGIGER